MAKIVLQVHPKTFWRDVEVKVNRTKFERGDAALRDLGIASVDDNPNVKLAASLTTAQYNTLSEIGEWGLEIEVLPSGALQAGIKMRRKGK